MTSDTTVFAGAGSKVSRSEAIPSDAIVFAQDRTVSAARAGRLRGGETAAAMRIDAHQHFWRPARGDYGWIDASNAPLFRDFEPDDLHPWLTAAGVGRTVLVQAAPTRAETDWLLTIARATPWVAGVVGWVDHTAPDAAEQIAELAEEPLLLGVRPALEDRDGLDRIGDPALARAFAALDAAGLVLDALVSGRAIARTAELAVRHPGLSIVLDHCGKPPIGQDLRRWRADMAALARQANVSCKLSGLMTTAPAKSETNLLRPVVDHLLACFGPDRLLWGSDWPVLTMASDYSTWARITDELLAGLDPSERIGILGGNAARVYGLGA